jgi:hypothetical protein
MTALTANQEITATILLALFERSEVSVAEAALGFRKLHRLAESLPLTTDEFCFAHNWQSSAEQLWEKGDRNAARYQVKQVVKNLML